MMTQTPRHSDKIMWVDTASQGDEDFNLLLSYSKARSSPSPVYNNVYTSEIISQALIFSFSTKQLELNFSENSFDVFLVDSL